MMMYALFVVISSLAFATAPPSPSTKHCKYNDKIYKVGDLVPNEDKCLKCKCYVHNGQQGLGCVPDDRYTPMCYNPVDNGPDACPAHRYTCLVRNCKTKSGHVLIDDEEKKFSDDGYCFCPPKPSYWPGGPWIKEHGEAICFAEKIEGLKLIANY